jgi:hypothetical protein
MLTSILCALLLAIGYRRSRARLLLWSCLCFTLLSVNNLMLFLDLVVLPQVDLGPTRDWSSVAAMALLVFGLIWDTQ